MKGQTAIFEQALLFLIGFTIFMMYLAVFNIYEGYFKSVGVNDQLTEVKNYVGSNILKLYAKEGANSSVTLKIPKDAGGQVYKIELSNKGLNVTNLVSSVSKHSAIYNINKSFSLSGNVTSISGRITIYKIGNEITIL